MKSPWGTFSTQISHTKLKTYPLNLTISPAELGISPVFVRVKERPLAACHLVLTWYTEVAPLPLRSPCSWPSLVLEWNLSFLEISDNHLLCFSLRILARWLSNVASWSRACCKRPELTFSPFWSNNCGVSSWKFDTSSDQWVPIMFAWGGGGGVTFIVKW